MKKIFALVPSATLLVFALIEPATAHAASATFFGPIVPAACNCPHGAASYGCVLATIENLTNFAVSLGVIIATLMFAFAGFTFMTNSTNPEGRKHATGMLINVFIGLIILLSAWLIVDFVMKTLYVGDNGSKDFGPWNSILAGTSGDQCIMAGKPTKIDGILGHIATGYAGGTGIQVGPTPGVATISGNEAAVRKQLADAGVSVNNQPCAEGSSGSGCTNVGGMRSTTIQQVITVSNACGKCGVVVTGGSEPGHASGTYSHGTGYKVDLRDTSAVNSLLNGLVHTGERGGDSGGPIYKDSCGNQYVHESDHWDITVYNACGLK